MSDDTEHDPFAASSGDPLVGQVIQDRYKIEKKLGQGGMGAVYLAEHVLIQKKVAIKCLHAGLATNADVVRRFHNEAVAATAIGHPNIVDVTDMGRFDDGTFFMALEYLAGRDWQDDLDKTGAQPLGRVAHIGMQICDALGAAAEKGIVHRDLKPENIFLIERHGDPDFVKVLDFGISKFQEGIGGSTRTGELMGTPYYMAPEQVRGERNISHVADIYALGVIFYQALTGNVPFDGNTLPELILKIASQPAPRLDERLDTMPEPIVLLVDAMLAKQAADRPQSFQEVSARLAPFIPDDSRLARSTHIPHAFAATAVGGSAEEAPLGLPVPERPRPITPVASRGPDTSAGGTPGAFGRTGVLGDDSRRGQTPEKHSSNRHGSTTTPHSLPTGGDAESQGTRAPSRPAGPPFLVPVAAAVIVLGAGGFFWLSQREASSAAFPTVEESKADVVRVQISTLPPDAEVLLDGEPISNPFDGEFERDKAAHELVVRREGFEETKRKMVLNSAQRIFIPLTALSSEKDEAREPESERAEPRQMRPVSAAPRVAPPPKPTPEPAPEPAPNPAPAPAPEPAPTTELKKIF